MRAAVLVDVGRLELRDVPRPTPAAHEVLVRVLLYGHGHAGVDLSVMDAVQFLAPALVSPVGASERHNAVGRPVKGVVIL